MYNYFIAGILFILLAVLICFSWLCFSEIKIVNQVLLEIKTQNRVLFDEFSALNKSDLPGISPASTSSQSEKDQVLELIKLVKDSLNTIRVLVEKDTKKDFLVTQISAEQEKRLISVESSKLETDTQISELKDRLISVESSKLETDIQISKLKDRLGSVESKQITTDTGISTLTDRLGSVESKQITTDTEISTLTDVLNSKLTTFMTKEDLSDVRESLEVSLLSSLNQVPTSVEVITPHTIALSSEVLTSDSVDLEEDEILSYTGVGNYDNKSALYVFEDGSYTFYKTKLEPNLVAKISPHKTAKKKITVPLTGFMENQAVSLDTENLEYHTILEISAIIRKDLSSTLNKVYRPFQNRLKRSDKKQQQPLIMEKHLSSTLNKVYRPFQNRFRPSDKKQQQPLISASLRVTNNESCCSTADLRAFLQDADLVELYMYPHNFIKRKTTLISLYLYARMVFKTNLSKKKHNQLSEEVKDLYEKTEVLFDYMWHKEYTGYVCLIFTYLLESNESWLTRADFKAAFASYQEEKQFYMAPGTPVTSTITYPRKAFYEKEVLVSVINFFLLTYNPKIIKTNLCVDGRPKDQFYPFFVKCVVKAIHKTGSFNYLNALAEPIVYSSDQKRVDWKNLTSQEQVLFNSIWG